MGLEIPAHTGFGSNQEHALAPGGEHNGPDAGDHRETIAQIDRRLESEHATD